MRYILVLLLCINLQANIKEVYKKAYKSVVLIAFETTGHRSTIRADKEAAVGSGFILSENGLIATNNHVIRAAEGYVEDGEKVIFKIGDYTGVMLEAKVVFRHNLRDVAILKIKDRIFKGYPKSRILDIADSSKVEVGDPALMVGSPPAYFNTLHTGIISGLHRFSMVQGNMIYDNMIQSNLNYSPGMSGSPLLNTEGQVIGINTMLVSDSLIGGQVDLAIPSNILSRCIHDYHKYGESKMSFLGIEVKMMTELYARKQNFKDRYGVLLSFVHRGHSAHKAGLRRNDRIISINDRLVYNRTSLRGFLNEYTIGTQIKIKVQRRNRVFDVHLKIGDLDSFKPPRRFRESRYFFLM